MPNLPTPLYLLFWTKPVRGSLQSGVCVLPKQLFIPISSSHYLTSTVVWFVPETNRLTHSLLVCGPVNLSNDSPRSQIPSLAGYCQNKHSTSIKPARSGLGVILQAAASLKKLRISLLWLFLVTERNRPRKVSRNGQYNRHCIYRASGVFTEHQPYRPIRCTVFSIMQA
jgi:hypothetical protein